MAGNVSFEDGAFEGNLRLNLDGSLREIEGDDTVDKLKILKAHEDRASRPLGGNETVDPVAEVLQHEILLGGRLAVVHFLRPLFERELDAERLVDGEGDVQKVEAVDAEVIDGMTLRLDLLARDIAGLGNNIRHGIEGRRHRPEKPLIDEGPTPWTPVPREDRYFNRRRLARITKTALQRNENPPEGVN